MRPIARRNQVIAYGTAAFVAVAGGVFAGFAPSLATELVGLTAMTLALGAIVLLVFYEIGLSEDRERAREEERRQQSRRPWRPI